MTPRIPLAALAALVALCVAPSLAAAARPAAPTPSVRLPGDASAAGVRADSGTWIVGLRPDAGAAGRRVARAHGARPIAGTAWLVSRRRATALAGALRGRGLLAYAEPNRIARRAQAPDPLSPQATWRDVVVAGQVPPPVGPTSPLIALIDSAAQVDHPVFAGGNLSSQGGQGVTDFHGTATAAVAVAAANGVGTLGVWPGARALNLQLPPTNILCSDSARNIALAIQAGAAVINMSYGAQAPCLAEYEQVQAAVRAGVVPVAAAGNEFDQGNPAEYPASLPHVVTVAATQNDQPAFFSNQNAAVDLSAPGSGVLTAVPAQFDVDGTQDGFATVEGTSFSAPMVAAAVAWVRAARPELTADQAAGVVRLGARDVGNPGWEPSTGFGVLSMAGALTRQPSPPDPLEPNDGFSFVNGRTFKVKAPPVFTGRKRAFIAETDYYEDPYDIYRLRVPGRKRIRIQLAPAYGDPDLYVYNRNATSLRQGKRIVAASRRRGKRRDTVTFRNHSRRTQTFYAVVTINRRTSSLNAPYALTMQRR